MISPRNNCSRMSVLKIAQRLCEKSTVLYGLRVGFNFIKQITHSEIYCKILKAYSFAHFLLFTLKKF